MPDKANLEVIVRIQNALGKQSLQGVCSNGRVIEALPIRSKPESATRADLAKAQGRIEGGCALLPQEEYAFEGIKRGMLTIIADPKTKTFTQTAQWQCQGKDDGDSVHSEVTVSAPDAPLPTPRDLHNAAKRMSDFCTYKIQEARAR